MSQGPPAAALASRLREALDVIATSHGCDLEEVEVVKAGNRSKVVVAVDRDGGVDLDTVADISRDISERLDALDLVPGAYTLDVGSRGVHRPLVEPRHWRRATGRLVKVELADGTTVTGRLTDFDGDTVTLVPQPDPRYHSTKPKPPVQVALADMRLALVEVDFRAVPPDPPDAIGDPDDDEEEGLA